MSSPLNLPRKRAPEALDKQQHPLFLLSDADAATAETNLSAEASCKRLRSDHKVGVTLPRESFSSSPLPHGLAQAYATQHANEKLTEQPVKLSHKQQSPGDTTTEATLSRKQPPPPPPRIDMHDKGRGSLSSLEPRGIQFYTDSDVLFGRGKTHSKHPGNRRMQEIVVSYRGQYNQLGHRDDKTDMAWNIVKQIQEEGGRFLKFNKTQELWFEVDDDGARKKVSHAIRDSGGSARVRAESASHTRPVGAARSGALNACTSFQPVTTGTLTRAQQPAMPRTRTGLSFAPSLSAWTDPRLVRAQLDLETLAMARRASFAAGNARWLPIPTQSILQLAPVTAQIDLRDLFLLQELEERAGRDPRYYM